MSVMIKQLMHRILKRYPFRSRQAYPSQLFGSGTPLSVDWVLPGYMAIGRLPRSVDVDTLKRSGIQDILALCSETEGPWSAEVQKAFYCHRIVIPDSHYSTPISPYQIAIAVRHIHQCIENNRPVFVHCLGGIERSPTICTAYLCRYHHYSLWEALSWIKSVHSDSLPSEHQLKAIQNYLDGCSQSIA